MRNVINCLLIIIFLASCGANPGKQGKEERQTETNYVFFLHNMFVELFPDSVSHPFYGRAEYSEVLEQYKKNGFIIVSERRPKGSDVKLYAKKLVGQIDSLLKLGIRPDHITVVGTSKGGYIAQYASTYLANPNVNFVLIGCFGLNDVKENPEINLCGNILSIYERTDTLGFSGKERLATSKQKVTRFKELELNTGLKHGFLYHPLPQWMEPSMQWARREYDAVN